MKRSGREALTHLSVLYKQHADGVLATEVEHVNVILNGHLREQSQAEGGWRRGLGKENVRRNKR